MDKQDKDKDKEDTNKKNKDKEDTNKKDKDKADTDKEGRRDGGGEGGEGGGYMGEILLPLLAATRQVSRVFYTLMDMWHILFNICMCTTHNRCKHTG